MTKRDGELHRSMTDLETSHGDQETHVTQASHCPERWRDFSRRHPDILAVLLLITFVLIGVAPLVANGITAGLDSLDYHYPMFSFLGEQLRLGNIPGWNPYQFSGSPFAADPNSGWMYLPAMTLYSMFPLATAAKMFLVFHFLLAALSMYALARALGISVLGAFVAAASFALSYFLYTRSVCCPAHVFVLTWIPGVLVFVRLASRTGSCSNRLVCWALAGLGLSQILGAWLGQGSYYVLILVAAFVAWQELFCPPRLHEPLVERLGRATLSLGVVFAWAGGFAAAGLLPRLEYINASNLAGGYSGDAEIQGGLSFADALLYPLLFGGVSIVILAVIAPFIHRHRAVSLFFAAVAAFAVMLSLDATTPLHLAAYALLPRFEDLHRHGSERILLVFYPAIAILAGVTVNSLQRWPRAAFAVTTLVLANLLLVNWWFPLAMSRQVDLDAYYNSADATQFLRGKSDQGPFRYFGYDPLAITVRNDEDVRYIWQMFDPATTALLINNWGTTLRLQDIQGYNPVHSRIYGDFMDRMNGAAQEYHGRYVLADGLDSPLLDLLNARFIVIPAEFAANRTDLRGLVASHPVVYRDDRVLVLENRRALPRAWIVHQARRVEPGAALDLLASGSVNPWTTVLLEDEPPRLAASIDLAGESVTVERYEPDAIRLRARADAPGLLVLSEVFYPAWTAYVDGNPSPILAADHILRAVALPPGEHLVELRYESTTLRVGIIISLLAFALVTLLAAAIAVRAVRFLSKRHAGRSSHPDARSGRQQ